MSLIAAVIKQPAERTQAGVDYSCWLRGPGKLVALDIAVNGFLGDEPVPTLQLFGAYISPSGKVVHILVEGGTDGYDYNLTVKARGSDGRIKEDQMVVRVEEAV